jgi:hypothetical protein
MLTILFYAEFKKHTVENLEPHPALLGRLHHHYHRHHPHQLRLSSIPWKEMLTNPASLAALFNSFAQGWVGLTLMAEMPAFMNQQLGLNIRNSGLLSSMPYVFNYLSVEGFSLFFDYAMVNNLSST